MLLPQQPPLIIVKPHKNYNLEEASYTGRFVARQNSITTTIYRSYASVTHPKLMFPYNKNAERCCGQKLCRLAALPRFISGHETKIVVRLGCDNCPAVKIFFYEIAQGASLLFVFPVSVMGSFHHEATYAADNGFISAFSGDLPLELVMITLLPPRPSQAIAAASNANDIEEIKEDQ